MLAGPLRGRMVFAGNMQWIRVPTADEVAAAVVAAAREFGIDPPSLILTGYGPYVDGHSRRKWNERRAEAKSARILCALALREAIPDAPRAVIARCLGVKGAKNFHSHAARARERASWWSEEAFARVVKSIRAVGTCGD